MLDRLIAAVANLLVSNLRNHADLRLSREEFRYSRISFSQYGEDLAVLRWLDEELGSMNVHHMYVDAGCFHPIWFSNTLLLNKRGWRGINIDMSQHKIDLFNQERQRDFNVCAALSDKIDSMECLTYGPGPTDRLSHRRTEQSVLGEEPIAATTVRTTTLDQVIAQCPGLIERIGYLNIDCEGHDLMVLKGLSIEKYRPALITIEAYDPKERERVTSHLSRFGYSHRETLHRTLLFVTSSWEG